MSKEPKDTTQKPNSSGGEPNASQPEKQSEPSASNETVREIFTRLTLNDPQFVPAKPSGKAFVIGGAKPFNVASGNPRPKEVKNSKGHIFFGEHISEQAEFTAIKTSLTNLRPGEPPLNDLSLVEQNWLASALKCLVQIDDYRNGEIANQSGHCIFDIGSAYIQCRAVNYAKYLICEAVSDKLVPDSSGAVRHPRVWPDRPASRSHGG